MDSATKIELSKQYDTGEANSNQIIEDKVAIVN